MMGTAQLADASSRRNSQETAVECGPAPTARPKGFAALSPERRRELASKGGKAVPPEKRTFSIANPTITHGITRSKEGRRLWDIHRKMIRRCTVSTDSGFKHYGARGIRVCDRWLASVEAFVSDMGPRPTPKHTVDRIDNDGPYDPENCRWATRAEQARNKRTTLFVIQAGRRRPLIDFAAALGMHASTVARMVRRGELTGVAWAHDDPFKGTQQSHAGRKGGLATGSSFAFDRTRAVEAGRKGGLKRAERIARERETGCGASR